MFFAENGTTDDLRRHVHGSEWAAEQTRQNVEVGSSYLEGEGPYPERLADLVLTGRFLDDYLEMLDRWAAWADEVVADWPDLPGDASRTCDAMAGTVERRRPAPNGGGSTA